MPGDIRFNFKFRLYSEGRNEEYQVLLLQGQPYFIGRQGTGLQLLDPSVSRIHCHFFIEGESIFVADDGSMNGTYVEGKRVERQEVFQGTVLQLGVYTIHVLETPNSLVQGRAPAPAPPPAEPPPPEPEPPRPVFEAPKRTAPVKDSLTLDFETIKRFLIDATTRPQHFFEETLFDGYVRKSAFIISGSMLFGMTLGVARTTAPVLLSNTSLDIFFRALTQSVVLLALATMLAIAQTIALAWLLGLLQKPLETNTTFPQYLRFFAYASILFAVGQVINLVTFGFSIPLVAVLLVGWTVFGLLKAFELALWPLLAAFSVYLMVWIVLQRLLMVEFAPYFFWPA
ncbi:MAG TPA: FHA domain-containing protein [Bdellovibrionales bacterium]|nr:FHA domain-containing protein [Bdellovibrionales bacterium]